MELRKLRHTRRAILKNAALAAFASPAIGQEERFRDRAVEQGCHFRPGPRRVARGLVLAEGQRSTHGPGSSRVCTHVDRSL